MKNVRYAQEGQSQWFENINFKGAFVWNQSGIRIIIKMRVSVCLGAILIPDFPSGYSAPGRNIFRNIFLFRNIPNEHALKLIAILHRCWFTNWFLGFSHDMQHMLDIFKHLRGSVNCGSLCSEDCFKILDSASTSFQLKIKEAMHILWEQPSLNSQVKHLNLSLSY